MIGVIVDISHLSFRAHFKQFNMYSVVSQSYLMLSILFYFWEEYSLEFCFTMCVGKKGFQGWDFELWFWGSFSVFRFY